MRTPVTFPVSVGLLEAKHVQAMTAQSLFVYLWFVEHVTKDSPSGNGQFSGSVLGGQPILLDRIAKELGMSYGTVKRYLGILIRKGYIESAKTGTGACSYTITKSKKWCWQRNGESAATPAPDKDSVDSRHAPACALIQGLFQSRFAVTCPWDGSEAKALKTLLMANPSWTEQQLEQMIRNRFSSDDITGERPRGWLPNLAKYHAAALDRFQKFSRSCSARFWQSLPQHRESFRAGVNITPHRQHAFRRRGAS